MSLPNSREAVEEGWEQFRAGVALVTWSRLVCLDHRGHRFVPVNETSFESVAGHHEIHEEYGRLISWIAFSVGAEYVLKGACLVHGLKIKKVKSVVRLPDLGEDLDAWIGMVNNKDDLSIHQDDISFGTLRNLPIQCLPNLGLNQALVLASRELLASAIRNRDIHRFAKNVRALHFHTIHMLFVPMLNAVLDSLQNQDELSKRLSGIE